MTSIITRRMLALVGTVAMAMGSHVAAQTPADYQALRKEVDLLRARLIALQKEVDTLKAQSRAAAAVPSTVPAAENIVLNMAKAPIHGAESARVVMVEIGDFECPYCGRFFAQTSPQIQKDYVETGKIRYAYLHMPIASHRFAFKAGEAAACAADQGKFWEMHDRLFSNQAQLAPAYLPEKATGLVADINAYKSCLETSKHAADIRSDEAMLTAVGVRATPTFFIGSLDPKTKMLKVSTRIVGAKSYGAFQEALERVLQTSAATGTGGK